MPKRSGHSEREAATSSVARAALLIAHSGAGDFRADGWMAFARGRYVV